MKRRRRAIVAGHLCLDIIPQFDKSSSHDLKTLFRPGGLTRVGPAILSSGGAVSNTGLILHRLGIPTLLVGKISDDLYGQAIRQNMVKFGAGLDQNLIVDPTVSTSYTVIINPPGIDRFFLHCPGANDDFSSGDIPFEKLNQADLFHFGYPPTMKRIYQNDGEELEMIFIKARQTGITTSLDLCMPDPNTESGQVDWRSILSRTLPHVDVFVPSLDELLYMLERARFEEYKSSGRIQTLLHNEPDLLSRLGHHLLNLGAGIVLIKLGECGAYLRTGNAERISDLGRAHPAETVRWSERELWAPCFRVDVAGTTGAGDSTIAGFLSALLRSLTAEAALTTAVAVGAFNVEAADALSGVPDWEVVQERINSKWERLLPCGEPAGWRWSTKYGLWIGPNDKSAGK